MVTSLEPGVISSTSPSVSFAVVMVAHAAYNIGPTIVQVPDSRGHAQCPWQPGRRGPRQTSIGYAQMLPGWGGKLSSGRDASHPLTGTKGAWRAFIRAGGVDSRPLAGALPRPRLGEAERPAFEGGGD